MINDQRLRDSVASLGIAARLLVDDDTVKGLSAAFKEGDKSEKERRELIKNAALRDMDGVISNTLKNVTPEELKLAMKLVTTTLTGKKGVDVGGKKIHEILNKETLDYQCVSYGGKYAVATCVFYNEKYKEIGSTKTAATMKLYVRLAKKFPGVFSEDAVGYDVMEAIDMPKERAQRVKQFFDRHTGITAEESYSKVIVGNKEMWEYTITVMNSTYKSGACNSKTDAKMKVWSVHLYEALSLSLPVEMLDLFNNSVKTMAHNYKGSEKRKQRVVRISGELTGKAIEIAKLQLATMNFQMDSDTFDFIEWCINQIPATEPLSEMSKILNAISSVKSKLDKATLPLTLAEQRSKIPGGVLDIVEAMCRMTAQGSNFFMFHKSSLAAILEYMNGLAKPYLEERNSGRELRNVSAIDRKSKSLSGLVFEFNDVKRRGGSILEPLKLLGYPHKHRAKSIIDIGADPGLQFTVMGTYCLAYRGLITAVSLPNNPTAKLGLSAPLSGILTKAISGDAGIVRVVQSDIEDYDINQQYHLANIDARNSGFTYRSELTEASTITAVSKCVKAGIQDIVVTIRLGMSAKFINTLESIIDGSYRVGIMQAMTGNLSNSELFLIITKQEKLVINNVEVSKTSDEDISKRIEDIIRLKSRYEVYRNDVYNAFFLGPDQRKFALSNLSGLTVQKSIVGRLLTYKNTGLVETNVEISDVVIEEKLSDHDIMSMNEQRLEEDMKEADETLEGKRIVGDDDDELVPAKKRKMRED